jgi:acetyltransferase-like isoleucine patch superfamily enzyme
MMGSILARGWRRLSRRGAPPPPEASQQPEPPPAAPPFLTQNEAYSGYRVGEWSYGSPRIISWGEGATFVIGRFCSVAGGVTILLGGEHRVDWVTTYPFNVLFKEAQGIEGHPKTKGDVTIGNDVWIGTDAFILSGVTVGDGAVIAARSVVTKDVPPYSIVAGNPARVVRYRFSQPLVGSLLRIAWWDWPLPKIVEALPLLLSHDVEAFVAAYGSEAVASPSQDGLNTLTESQK